MWSAGSLRIAQDDEDEKNREIAKMSQIYGSFAVTVSAARQSAARMVSYRDATWAGTASRSTGCRGSTRKAVERLPAVLDMRRPERRLISTSGSGRYENLKLPPLLLKFGTSQVLFTYQDPGKSEPSVQVDGELSELLEDAVELSSDEKKNLLRNWRTVIEQYTSRSLRRQEDRLSLL